MSGHMVSNSAAVGAARCVAGLATGPLSSSVAMWNVGCGVVVDCVGKYGAGAGGAEVTLHVSPLGGGQPPPAPAQDG